MVRHKINEYKLIKSKDDYSFEHYKNSPLEKQTGFSGTAGEAIIDDNSHITLFVDPRYHIQAKLQTKNKNVDVVEMQSQFGFITYLKNFLPKNSTLFIPEKSTSLLSYLNMKKELKGVKIETYITDEDCYSIDNEKSPVFEVDKKIAGKSAQDKIKSLKIENLLIVDLEQIAYLLNLRSYKTKNASTFRAKLFIKNSSEVYLFCDYKLPKTFEFIKVLPLSKFESFIKKINDSIELDYKTVSLHEYNLIKNPKNLEKNPIVKMMSAKNSAEIKHYIDSFKRLDVALFKFKSQLKEGLSEFELNKIFERELLSAGAKTTSFKTILALDDNSSIIHYTACSKEKILKKGSVILLDCGGYYEGGYATDITRVFGFGEEFCDTIKEIYTAVLKAQLNVYHSNTLMTDELDRIAKKILNKYEKKGFYFPHGLGHGLGIAVHQPPIILSSKVKMKLKNKNVFTIEPGLYSEGKFGVRLENSVYIDKGKIISLSHFPYDEKLIDYKMLNKKELNWLKIWQDYAKRIYE